MCKWYKNKLHNSNQKLKSEISTAELELELKKLDRNQKFLKKNLDSKPEISIESESKNMNALLLTNSLLCYERIKTD